MARSFPRWLPLLALLTAPGVAGARVIVVDAAYADWVNVSTFSDPNEVNVANDLRLFATTSNLGANGTPDANDTLYVRMEMWDVQGGGNPPAQTITFTYPNGTTDRLDVRAKSVGLAGCNNCTTFSTAAVGATGRSWEISIPFNKLKAGFAAGNYLFDVHVDARGAQDRVPANGEISYDAARDVATPVQLIAQAATALPEGGVRVAWVTGSEVRNAGFRVWKATPRGKVAASALVPAEGTPGSGTSYEIFDDGGRAGDVYQLEDIDEDGVHTLHPPLRALRGGPGPARVDVLHARVAPAAALPPRLRKPDPDLASVAMLGASAEGIYAIDPADLIAAGIDPAVAVSRTLRLSQDGRQLDLVPTKGGVLFYARPPRNAYDGVDRYRLEDHGGPAPAPRRVKPVASSSLTTFRSTVTFDANDVYDWYTTGDDPYAWMLIRPSARGVATLLLPDAAARGRNAHVVVRMHGGRVFVHRYEIVLNGTVLGVAQWEDKKPAELAFDVPATLLDPAGNNVLEIRGAVDANPSDYIYLTDVAVTYDRRFVAVGDELLFEAPAGRPVVVRGFHRSDVVLLDVTRPDAPRAIAATAFPDGAGGFSLGFIDAGVGTIRYRAATPAAILRPTVRKAEERLVLERPSADLLIVTTRELRSELDPLVEARERQGLRVEVMTVEEIADAYADGEAGPDGLRAMVHDAVEHGGPRYLLLAGQGSMDPRGTLGGSDREQVPTKFTVTSEWTLREPSDAWFGLDGRNMKLAVGRIPARTPAELRIAVRKIIANEKVPGGARTVLVNDGPQDADAFTHTVSELGAELAGLDVETLAVDANPDASTTLKDHMATTDLVAFVGHGWISGWGWSGTLLTGEGVAALGNAEHQPFVIASTCWEGNFSDTRGIALATTMLFTEGAGSTGSFSPTSMLNAADHSILVRGVVAAAAGGVPTIGDAVRAGQQAFLDLGSDRLDSLHGFALLGDPSARNPLQR